VVSWENHPFLLNLLLTQPFFFDLQMDKPGENVQKPMPFQHVFPKIGRLVAIGIIRVASAALTAFVKR